MSMSISDVIAKLNQAQLGELDEVMQLIVTATDKVDDVIGMVQSCHDSLGDTEHQNKADAALSTLGMLKAALDNANAISHQAESTIADTITSCRGF